jgi:predicted phosphodiesterase
MKRKSNLSALLTGMAAGAGLILLRNEYVRRNPDAALAQMMVSRALDRELQRARAAGAIQLAPEHRYVIFSDHHKGAGDDADDFRKCKPAYLAALDHYFEHGYTLIVLGDSEELWEQDIPEVLQTYPDVMESEARFHPGRYIRVIGNHDNPWEDPLLVQRYLEPLFPKLQFHNSVLFDFQDGEQTSGQLFLVHGHQGTLDSEVFGFLPPLVLPIYRQIQNLTGIGHTSPSREACLRAEHDTMMYRWASQKGKLLLICGHTHRPVWSSLTHLEKLSRQLYTLLGLAAHERPADYEEQVSKLTGELKEREEKHRPCKDTIKTNPCYFNTGCCRFDDGDITGIELKDGILRLIKWGRQNSSIQRTEFEASHLSTFFALL